MQHRFGGRFRGRCPPGAALVERWGARLRLNSAEIEWVDRWFDRRGSIAVLIGRLLPIVRTFIALPAGIARMNRVRFHVYTFVGSWFWCLALAYVGMQLGERWDSDPRLKAWMHSFDIAIVGIFVLAVGALFWFRRRRR